MQKNKNWKLVWCALLLGLALLGNTVAAAVQQQVPETAYVEIADYMTRTVSNPQVGSTGGEWAVLGLARSGCEIPEGYFQAYYQNVQAYVEECGGQLNERKYTEYARVVLALTAIGKDPTNVAGYNLLTPLGDFEKAVWQGINGPIWALLALDSGGYDMPQNPNADTQATRDLYLEEILSRQLPDGGWSLTGGTQNSDGTERSDPDVTAMALQALAKYQERDEVKQAVDRALTAMSARQNGHAGFESWGIENIESCAQMIVALCELGIPHDDARFVKNGQTMLDNLMTYYEAGKGFAHEYGKQDFSLMATEQGFYAMAAIWRQTSGKNSLYDMTDVIPVPDEENVEPSVGLPGKHGDVKVMERTEIGKTFSDIITHPEREAIEALAERSIINGKTEDLFAPDETMTRAEFAAIVVRGLGLQGRQGTVFVDVSAGEWFYPYVNAAYAYGIVTGVSEQNFQPDGTITREEAATMVARAAGLCGLQTEMDMAAARNVLAAFTDYVTVSQWAMPSVAFCYQQEILPDDALEIQPAQAITRAEVAHMLYHLLLSAKLL